MTELLIRLFVPNRERVEDPVVRGRYGALAGIVGILCNFILFAGKLAIGLFSKSVAITADAVNNLSDAASSIMTLLGFRLSQKPADVEHPYGHARFEYISGLGVAALILVIGAQLAISSAKKILNPETVLFSPALVTVLVLSILIKLWMALFNWKLGRRISSTTLTATAADSRNDVISTAAVLISAVAAHITGLELDGYIGFLVALFILYNGIQIGRDTIRPLLGSAADPELVEMIRRETMGFHPCILGIHDLMVHDYGPGRCFASLHAEIDYREDVLLSHEVIDDIECMFREKHHLELVIHHDPVVTDDEELNQMQSQVMKAMEELDPRVSAHDFRLVRGKSHSNLIFDVVVPYDLMQQQEEIGSFLTCAVQTLNPSCHAVITFDSPGFNQL